MRSRALHRLAAALLFTVAATAVLSSPASTAPRAMERKASRTDWPDTKAGAVARGWVEAFSTGEDAMRAFLRANLTAESLEKRTMSERIASYRKLREKYETLTLFKVDSSAPGELKATLMAADASRRQFTFTVQKDPPYRLLSVTIRESVPGGHFGFGH